MGMNGEWRRGCKVHGRGGVEGTWTDSCNLRPHERKSQVGHGIAKERFFGGKQDFMGIAPMKNPNN